MDKIGFSREAELQRLGDAITSRNSLLVYGPAGVGKTHLLRITATRLPGVLYCDSSKSAQSVVRQIAKSLVEFGNHVAVKRLGPDGAKENKLSVVALKGITSVALHAGSYSIILDHAGFASQAFVSALKGIAAPSATPLIVVARSAHMEELGFLLKLFPFRADKFEIRNFDPAHTRDFVAHAIREAQLDADNLAEVQGRLVHASAGNPGAILRMVDLAKQPKYRSQRNVLFAPLHIDFKLHWQGNEG